MENSLKRMLVYDSVLGGHHARYITYLLDHVLHNPQLKMQLIVCTPPDLVNYIDKDKYSRANIIFDLRDFDKKITQHQSYGETDMRLIEELVSLYKVNEVLFMFLDGLFKPISLYLDLRKYNCRIRGIYLGNYVRWKDKNLSIPAKLKVLARYRLSSYFWLVKSSRKISEIYVLADHWSARRLNNTFLLKRIFKFIPEPVVAYPAAMLGSFNVREKLGISNSAKVFLITGVLAHRKNVPRILQAVHEAARKTSVEIWVLIAGPLQASVEIEYRQEIINSIEQVRACGKIKVLFEERVLTDEELCGFIFASNFICIPYYGFYTPSAILVQALINKKPVLAPNVGYSGEIATTYSLGPCVNPYDVGSIAEGASALLQGYPLDEKKIQSFLQTYSPYPEAFARTLVE